MGPHFWGWPLRRWWHQLYRCSDPPAEAEGSWPLFHWAPVLTLSFPQGQRECFQPFLLWLPPPNFWYQCPRSPSLDTPAEHTVGWTAGLKDSVSLTTSFFPVTKPRQMLMFFPMSLISCASLVVSGTIEILSSSVHSLPGFSHLFWHLFISSASSVPSRVLSPLPMSVMVYWVNGSSYTHFPPCWIHYSNACLQLSLLCQFFWLFLTYSGPKPWGSPRVLS